VRKQACPPAPGVPALFFLRVLRASYEGRKVVSRKASS
jgi:hypothetical protein